MRTVKNILNCTIGWGHTSSDVLTAFWAFGGYISYLMPFILIYTFTASFFFLSCLFSVFLSVSLSATVEIWFICSGSLIESYEMSRVEPGACNED